MSHSRFFQRSTTAVRKGAVFCLMLLMAFPVYAVTPDDEHLDELWYIDNLELEDAWDTATGDDAVVIAILDTGVDLDHPDLEENIWENTDEIAGDGIDNDGNGFVDDVHGYDFVDGDGIPIPNEGETAEPSAVSHGTVIAGIAGAVGDNEEGIVGVNWDIEIMSVRILDNMGIGNSSRARQGVDYAVANGADVINLSFTGFDFDDALRRSLQDAYEAGVVVVAAVGNTAGGGINTDVKPIFPACYGERADQDWILGVASTDEDDVKSSFSNYGAECTDISAPGEDIYSAIYQSDDWEGYEEYYQAGWSGTSMASPMVAGAAALLFAAHPSLTPDDIKSALRLSVDPVTASGDAVGKMGAGRLNVARALELSASFVDGDEEEGEEEIETEVVASDASSSYRIVVGPEGGDPPTIRVFNNSGSEVVTSFNAYSDDFDGGVRLALGDVDGDGEEEIVVVPGEGETEVRIFSLTGELEQLFDAFDGTVASGFFVATGDINGDGIEEIAVSTDTGGGARVAMYNHTGELQEDTFKPFDDFEGSRSVRVALGDVDGDGMDEVLTSLGSGHAPYIRVHKPDGTFHSEFLAYAETYKNGVFVASGDLDGDGDDEIVTGTDDGGGPQVQIFDGQGTWLGTFFAYDDQFRGGVRLSVGNLSEWPGASIITAAGPGGGPHIRVYNGYAELIGTFFSDDENDRDGINSASWSL